MLQKAASRSRLFAARLKGFAGGFSAVASLGGSYEDLLCRTMSFAVMILTVLNITNDALNVLVADIAAAIVLLIVFHYFDLLSESSFFIICQFGRRYSLLKGGNYVDIYNCGSSSTGTFR